MTRINVRFTVRGRKVHGDVTHDPEGRGKIVFVAGYWPERADEYAGRLPGHREEWVCEVVRDTKPAQPYEGALIVRLVEPAEEQPARWRVDEDEGVLVRVERFGAKTSERQFDPASDTLPDDAPADVEAWWRPAQAQARTARRQTAQALLAEARERCAEHPLRTCTKRGDGVSVRARLIWRDEDTLVRTWYVTDDLVPVEDEVLFEGPIRDLDDVRRLLEVTRARLVHPRISSRGKGIYGLWPADRKKSPHDDPPVEIEFRAAWLAGSSTARWQSDRLRADVDARSVEVEIPLSLSPERRRGDTIRRARTEPSLEGVELAPQIRTALLEAAEIRSAGEHTADFAIEQLRARRAEVYSLSAFARALLGDCTVALTTEGLVAVDAGGVRRRHLECAASLRRRLGVEELAEIDALEALADLDLAAFTAGELDRRCRALDVPSGRPGAAVSYDGPPTILYEGTVEECPAYKRRRVERLRAEFRAMIDDVRECVEALRQTEVAPAAPERRQTEIVGFTPTTTCGLTPTAAPVYTGPTGAVEIDDLLRLKGTVRYTVAEPYDGAGLQWLAYDAVTLPRGTIVVTYYRTNSGYATTWLERAGVADSKVALKSPWLPGLSRHVPEGAFFALPGEAEDVEVHPSFTPPDVVELTWEVRYSQGGYVDPRYVLSHTGACWRSLASVGGFVKKKSRRRVAEGTGTYRADPAEPVLHEEARKVVPAAEARWRQQIDDAVGLLYGEGNRPFPPIEDEPEPMDTTWLGDPYRATRLATYYLAPDGRQYVAVGASKNLGKHEVFADGRPCRQIRRGDESVPTGWRWFEMPAETGEVRGRRYSDSGNLKDEVTFEMPAAPEIAGAYEVVTDAEPASVMESHARRLPARLRPASYDHPDEGITLTPLRPRAVLDRFDDLLTPRRTKGYSRKQLDELYRRATRAAREWWLDVRPPDVEGWACFERAADDSVVAVRFVPGLEE